MRWVGLSALTLGLILTPSLYAESTAGGQASVGAQRAKSLSPRGSAGPDAFALACERARQIALAAPAGAAQPPAQKSPRFLTFDTEKEERAGVVYAWAVPDAESRANAALALVGKILAGDLTTRLNEELIVRHRLSASTRAWLFGLGGTDLFVVQVAGVQTVQIEQVEATVETTLGRLASAGPDELELEHAKFWLQAELRDKAAGQIELSTVPEAYRAVGREDVRLAVAEYLTAARKTTVEVRPRGSPEPWVPKPSDISRPPFRLHTVKSGETLKMVAKRHGVSAEALVRANGLDKKRSPYVGQTLKVPRKTKRAAATKLEPRSSPAPKLARKAKSKVPKAAEPKRSPRRRKSK